MISGMKQVIDTSEDGARLTPEQLADAGVEPGERAVIEIRPYSEEDGSRRPKARCYRPRSSSSTCAAPRRRVAAAHPRNMARFLRCFNRLPTTAPSHSRALTSRRGSYHKDGIASEVAPAVVELR
jgi:hypothetical protein